jgi:membrane-associated phospholipid phosphatase
LFASDNRPRSVFSAAYLEELRGDGEGVLSAPARWRSQEWKDFSLAIAGILGTGILLDHPVKDLAARNRSASRDRMADAMGTLGTTGAAGFVGGLYLYGACRDDREAKVIAMDALTASILASGVLAPATKILVGRARPEDSGSSTNFKPFRQSDPGFPSNHTVEAFAVASVVSAHLESRWGSGTAYGLATLVGLSRMQLNQHYASDVVAGAILGTVVGRAVAFGHSKSPGHRMSLAPELVPGGLGVTLVARF